MTTRTRKPKAKVRRREWHVHAEMFCGPCDKVWDNYRTAVRLAAKHTRETGHKTHGEVGNAVTFEIEK